MRQIILDTETTGLSCKDGDRVIELGCVELENRQITGRNLHLYFKVDREIDPEAQKIHGISADFLKDKPTFDEKVGDFISFIQGAEVLIHNAAFDQAFLDTELALVGKPPLSDYVHSITDTLAMARKLFPGKRNSLDALCDRFEIDKSARVTHGHGALLDSELLALVYIALTRGQETLMMDDDRSAEGIQNSAISVDLKTYNLMVLSAQEEEITHHHQLLDDLEKELGAPSVWRQTIAQPV